MGLGLAEILFIIVVLLANIIQTITGFAGTVLAMPASIRLVGYDVARPILNFVAIIVCLIVVIRNYKEIKRDHFLFLLGFVGIGLLIGYGLNIVIKHFDINQAIIFKIYGVIICLIAILFLFFKFEEKNIPTWVELIILIIAGIIHYLYTSGGPLVVVYAITRIKEKKEFRATLSLMWVILNSFVFGIDLIGGKFNSGYMWMLAGIVSAISLVSIIIGKLIVGKLNQKVFLKITFILLFISGLSAII